MLNDVRLDDLFAALESSVVHDRGVDGRLVSVEESRHNLSRYRPEHESVAGEARRVPEVLHVGLAEYRGGVRGHVVVAGPLAHDADVLRARQQLDDLRGDLADLDSQLTYYKELEQKQKGRV